MDGSDRLNLRQGAIWTAFGAIAGVLSQLVIMLTLALLLGPEAVGLFAVFAFVLGLGLTLFPLGHDYAFVQAADLTRGDVSRVIALATLAAGALALVAFGFSAAFWGAVLPLGRAVLFGIAVGLAEALFLLASAVLQRGLNYRAIERVNITRHILTLVLSLSALALSGQIEGAYLGRLISNLGALCLMAGPLGAALRPGRARQPVMPPLARDMIVSGTLSHLSRNAEVMVATPQLGVVGLGLYDFGRRIIAQPVTFLGTILSKFAYPLFAKIGQIECAPLRARVLRRSYGRIARSAALVGFPLFALALLLADPLIPVLFGPDWAPSVRVAQIFALAAFVQVLGNNIATTGLVAMGGSDRVLRVEYLILGPRLLAIFAASFAGPVVLAVVASLFNLIKLVWMQAALNARGGTDFAQIAGAVRGVALAMGLGLLLALASKPLLGDPWQASALALILFCGVYGVLVWRMGLGRLRP